MMTEQPFEPRRVMRYASEPVVDDDLEIVPNIDGYEKLPTPLLERMAAGGDEAAQWEVDRRQPPPQDARDPSTPPTVPPGEMPLFDVVVNDQPYHAMPVQLLRNLAAEGDAGAVEELERRGLPVEAP